VLSNQYTKHLLLAGAATIAITLALFYLMASLVTNPGKLGKSDASENMIDFLRTIKPRDTEMRNRRIPKKPPEPKVAPKIPKMAVAKQQDNIQTPQMAMNTPLLDSPLALGDGPYLGGATGGGSADGEPIPLVKPLPQYPRKAARAGKEGFVVLQIDITAAGTVENVRLVRSKPRRLFDQSAMKNAYQYRYRPKMVDGKPVAKKDHLVQIDFKIQR
jgi:protein TonB